ncbi:MAG: NAD(+)/NADH kinase [Chloroflexi bacterium]|jgi:NAD+ kinase|nr:NAD(+)/NADH kinase [Chloroflexota bacterium]MBT4142684.1 NAD(+)/NADH kinase [Chloroflexota bacterium]MBT4943990.1 NAD(+)/NADH kinase [Chloroflexota bacterium]MBT5252135.1 NAD(+)/NADH kinase [Chloroflexota bacterium]MBT5476206.1 NAD(+)/NADH kinase [Chloroflexota bacterium]
MASYHNIGIVHNGELAEAGELACKLTTTYPDGRNWWLATQSDLHEREAELANSDLIVTIGGDGTILRGAHAAASRDIPILGINMGRVGFMSDIENEDAVGEVGWYLEGNARIEHRFMLKAVISRTDGDSDPILALNDVTLARGATLRVIEVSTVVDGVHLATYRGDGVVVSTATGSTGYSLALGGPVMDPTSKDFLVKPIASHMSQFGGAILQSSSTVELTVEAYEDATLNADGFIDHTLSAGEMVTITQSGDFAAFLRRKPAADFWGDLSTRLELRKGSVKSPPRRRI